MTTDVDFQNKTKSHNALYTQPNHAQSPPMSLITCVRDSLTHDPDSSNELDCDKSESKKKMFLIRGLRKIFRRKPRHSPNPAPGCCSESDEQANRSEDSLLRTETEAYDPQRSRSTSELLSGDDASRRKSGSGFYNGCGGLSVSHDSVFTGEPHSGSDPELNTAHSASSLSMKQGIPGIRAELMDAVKRRRKHTEDSEDEDDLGISGCNSSMAVESNVDKTNKQRPINKSGSTCSDGSLLSIGSSDDIDEDSGGVESRNSSRLSLQDKKPTGKFIDSDLDLVDNGSVPLSHSAAKHRMAIRPKRSHGVPRKKRAQITTVLPATPEVIEESSNLHVSPNKRTNVDTPDISTERTLITSQFKDTLNEQVKHKSSSLPPGLALSQLLNGTNTGEIQLSRSRSNVQPYHEDGKFEDFARVKNENKEKDEKKKEETSFFGRWLSRRSGKRRKERLELEPEKPDDKPESTSCVCTNTYSKNKRLSDEFYQYKKTDADVTTEKMTHYIKNKSSGQRKIDELKSSDVKYRKLDDFATKTDADFRLPPSGFVNVDKRNKDADNLRRQSKSKTERIEIRRKSSGSLDEPMKKYVETQHPRQRSILLTTPKPPDDREGDKKIFMDVEKSQSDDDVFQTNNELSEVTFEPNFVTQKPLTNRIIIGGLSSYQKKIAQFSDESPKKKDNQLLKSHSFKTHTRCDNVDTVEMSSLPYSVNWKEKSAELSREAKINPFDLKAQITRVKSSDSILSDRSSDFAKSNENLRKSSLTLAKSTESVKKSNENIRKSSESMKKIEFIKKSTENLDNSTESVRKSNENIRKSSESIKKMEFIKKSTEKLDISTDEKRHENLQRFVKHAESELNTRRVLKRPKTISEGIRIADEKFRVEKPSQSALSLENISNPTLNLDSDEKINVASNVFKVNLRRQSFEIGAGSAFKTPEFMKVQLNRIEKEKVEEKEHVEAKEMKTDGLDVEKIDGFDLSPDDAQFRSLPDDPNVKKMHFLKNKFNSLSEKKCEKSIKVDDPPVILRKKSISTKEDEPELIKVFARRSLKLTADETMQHEHVISILNNEDLIIRDSDKENDADDEWNSMNQSKIKPFVDSAFRANVSPEKLITPSLSKSDEVKDIKQNPFKLNERFQFKLKDSSKSIVKEKIDGDLASNNNSEANRSEKIDSNKNASVSDSLNNNGCDELTSTFKRIQQRKEEWEQRMKRANNI